MYEQIAQYYDAVHEGLTADVGFVLTQAGRAGGLVLELGCGTGRLLLPLARAGHQVIGVDNSAAMLARARARLAAEPEAVRERVTLVEADMTSFAVDGRFALAIIPYNTFLHLSRAQKSAALKRIHAHLVPGGRLLIDLINPLAAAQTPDDHLLTLERVFTDKETGNTVVQMASSWPDLDAQILHITWLFDASPPTGGPIQRTVVQSQYHYLYPHELELLLTDTGFYLQAIYGAYNQTPYDEESERLLILASR
jgi:SAM-dependent methyltransferase